MGYNTAFLMIEQATEAEALGLFDAQFEYADLFASSGERLDWESASSQFLHPNLALGAVGGWAVLWDPSAQIVHSDFPNAASQGRRVMTCYFSSADSRYEFALYQDGTMLPEESRLAALSWGPDEDILFERMTRLTRVTFRELSIASYQRLEFLG